MSEGGTLLQLAQIASLKDKEDWRALVEKLERKEAREIEKAAKAVLSDGKFDQRDADFARGFVHALRWVKDRPRQAQVNYNLAKRKDTSE